MSSLKQWEAFQSGVEAPDVSATVLTSWRRSRWSGVHADRVTIPVHDASSTHTRLVAVAEPVMLKMADALADSRTSLALADRCGRVIWRWASDDQLARALDSVDMVPGAVFDEALVGTNGIGTALEQLRGVLDDLNAAGARDVQQLNDLLPDARALLVAGQGDSQIAEQLRGITGSLQEAAGSIHQIAATADTTVGQVATKLDEALRLVRQLNAELTRTTVKLAPIPAQDGLIPAPGEN